MESGQPLMDRPNLVFDSTPHATATARAGLAMFVGSIVFLIGLLAIVVDVTVDLVQDAPGAAGSGCGSPRWGRAVPPPAGQGDNRGARVSETERLRSGRRGHGHGRPGSIPACRAGHDRLGSRLNVLHAAVRDQHHRGNPECQGRVCAAGPEWEARSTTSVRSVRCAGGSTRTRVETCRIRACASLPRR